jgi:hypothetical protein
MDGRIRNSQKHLIDRFEDAFVVLNDPLQVRKTKDLAMLFRFARAQ